MEAQKQPNKQKKRWYKKWWGITLLVVFVAPPVLGILFALPSAIEQASKEENSSTTNQQQASQQAQTEAQQAAIAKRQSVIDKYSASYCKNHTNVQMRNDKVLTDGGWPTYDGKRNWTAEECRLIITMLYDTGTAEDRIASISEGRKIGVGLRNVEVIYSVGYPDDINTTTTAAGTHEQWVYGNPIYGANYVYLDNGIVTSYQQ